MLMPRVRILLNEIEVVVDRRGSVLENLKTQPEQDVFQRREGIPSPTSYLESIVLLLFNGWLVQCDRSS